MALVTCRQLGMKGRRQELKVLVWVVGMIKMPLTRRETLKEEEGEGERGGGMKQKEAVLFCFLGGLGWSGDDHAGIGLVILRCLAPGGNAGDRC